MSRVANNPVTLPKGVDIKVDGSSVSVKGGKGTMEMALSDGIEVKVEEGQASLVYDFDTHRAMAGTTRALLNNIVIGVSQAGRRSWS